jgi:hypothetical protein
MKAARAKKRRIRGRLIFWCFVQPGSASVDVPGDGVANEEVLDLELAHPLLELLQRVLVVREDVAEDCTRHRPEAAGVIGERDEADEQQASSRIFSSASDLIRLSAMQQNPPGPARRPSSPRTPR